MPEPFHLAFPVRDLAQARSFYGGLLGCAEGRSDERWIDFNLFGHQIVAHLVDYETGETPVPLGKESTGETPIPLGMESTGDKPAPASNVVDGHDVPVPHFGVVLAMDQWRELADRLTQAGVAFVIEPYIRFAGQTGEQATMFFRDPSGNALEFKAFVDPSQLFTRD